MEIQNLINKFADAVVAAVREEVRAEVLAGLGGRASTKKNGKVDASIASATKKPRKKGPIQLCPVPGCKERAAPVYGMVCKKHKDLPKANIKKYREARRAKAKKSA